MAGYVDTSWAISVQEEVERVIAARSNAANSTIRRVPRCIRDLKLHCFDCVSSPLSLHNRDFRNITPTYEVKLEVVGVFLKHLNLVGPNGWHTFYDEVAKPPPNAPALHHFYDNPLAILPSHLKWYDLCLPSTQSTSCHSLCQPSWTNWLPLSAVAASKLKHSTMEILSRATVRYDALIFTIHDMLAFENQISLVLIRTVLKRITRGWQIDDILRLAFAKYYSGFVLAFRSSAVFDLSFQSHDHLLACMHPLVSGESHGSTSPSANTKHWRSVPTASQLHKLGIRFRGSRTSVTDIKFDKSLFTATLHLPELAFSDSAERLLLNLCAYDIVTLNDGALIAYLRLLDDLVNTDEDVQLLRKGNHPAIAQNVMGDDNMVADVINRLLDGLIVDPSYYEHLEEILHEIHSWHDTWWRRALMGFVARFETAPWIFFSLVAATALLSPQCCRPSTPCWASTRPRIAQSDRSNSLKYFPP